MILFIVRFHFVEPGFEEDNFNSGLWFAWILDVTYLLNEKHQDEEDNIEARHSKVDAPSHRLIRHQLLWDEFGARDDLQVIDREHVTVGDQRSIAQLWCHFAIVFRSFNRWWDRTITIAAVGFEITELTAKVTELYGNPFFIAIIFKRSHQANHHKEIQQENNGKDLGRQEQLVYRGETKDEIISNRAKYCTKEQHLSPHDAIASIR